MAGQNMLASLSFLFCTLLSTRAEADLQATNPFLSAADKEAMILP